MKSDAVNVNFARPERNKARDFELPWAMTDDPGEFALGCWRELASGVKDMRHGFHTGSIATLGANGGPAVRTVVLRWVDEEKRQLGFHVDARSDKAKEMLANPKAAWLSYDAGQRLQIRLTGHVTVHIGDDLAKARWKASAVTSRICYLTVHAPGSTVTLPPPQAGKSLDEWAGFENFAVVVFEAEGFDAVFLHSGGHRRVKGNDVQGLRWVGP